MDITKVTKPARRLLKLKYCGAVIVAAGNASRMAGIDKVMAPLGGEPMLLRTVRTFQNCDAIKEIVVVTREDLLVQVMGLCKNFDKVTAVIAGGKDRPESVTSGLNALSNRVKLVAVHDGARPLLSLSDWQRLQEAAENASAALLVRPMTDTVKQTEGGKVLSTIPRESLSAALTPQIFETKLLLEAYAAAREGGYSATDDAELVEKLGLQPLAIPARDPNPKITFPPDLAMAEALLSARQCRKESREK